MGKSGEVCMVPTMHKYISNNFSVIMSTYLLDIAFQSLRFPVSGENMNHFYKLKAVVL